MDADEVPNWQDDERRALSLIDKGTLFHQLGQNAESLASYEEAVTICRAFSHESDEAALVLSQALDNKANALVDLGRLAEAIAVFDEAIQVHEGIVRGDGTWQDMHEIAISLMNKGRAVLLLEHYDEARVCFERALENFELCESSIDLARTWLNFGSLCVRQKRFDAALTAFDKSLANREAVIDESDVGRGDYAYTLFGKAHVLMKLGRDHEALDFCDRAAALQREIAGQTRDPSEWERLAETLQLNGEILTKLGHAKEADESFREAARLKGKMTGLDEDTN